MERLCGVEKVKKIPLEPYSDLVCNFLDAYSSALRKDHEAKTYPDVMTFAFWARKANILQRKNEYFKQNQGTIRVGRGIVFHIAPSNVPVNFMFSFAFGLLAGNANIVRVPSKRFPQVDCMCRVLEQVLLQDKYQKIHDMCSVVRYEKNKAITDDFSMQSNVRVIWGGDNTIKEIRTSELPARSIEITFADRYSFGVVNAKVLLNSSQEEKRRLAEQFYNDTYLMDQNACSTPHLICWYMDGMSVQEWKSIQEDFWLKVKDVSAKYDLADMKVSEKYTTVCENIISNEAITNLETYSNLLYVCDMNSLEKELITEIRGKYGLFYQYCMDDVEELKNFSDEKIQTCAYYGMDAMSLGEMLRDAGCCGVDRIVPFGKTLDIDVIWDGYDLISQMSRIIQIQN